MKITICGSTAFIDAMETVAKQLQSLGHEVKFPPVSVVDENGNQTHTRDYYALKKTLPKDESFWRNHTQRIKDHFKKVEWCEAILVTNYHKNGIAYYIGPNTLMEMGLAFHLGKKIFLLYPIPEIHYKEEILGLRPIIINNDLNLLKAAGSVVKPV